MITIRKSHERGSADHGWLKSHHTFSFASYYDPRHIHFRQLRVINEDFVAPNAGFPTHGHDNMEIITYVVSGTVAHQDSMGNSTLIRAGEVQVMGAGSGITHSEMNPSDRDWLHLFQIWVFPKTQNTEPRYTQRLISPEEKHNQFAKLVGPFGSDYALQMDQDAHLLAGYFDTGQATHYAIQDKRHLLIHAVSGELTVNGSLLQSGDAAFVSQESLISIDILSAAELLLFDLA